MPQLPQLTTKAQGQFGAFVAYGMIATLLGGDLKQLMYWSDIDPAFVGGALIHIGAVFIAYKSGRKTKEGEME